jgi:hypothetical protein
VAPETLVWAVGAVAAGWGIRAVARGCEVDPPTVLGWGGAVADHAAVFARPCLPEVRVTPGHLAALCALLSAVQADAVSETAAPHRLARSPRWVGGAIDISARISMDAP